MIGISLTIFSSFEFVVMYGLERKCKEPKEHNQTYQTFTEARLYLLKKGNLHPAT